MIHKITQSDIDAGEPGMCSDCPVALALLRYYDWVNVNSKGIETWMKDRQTSGYYMIPKKVAKFIKRFDAYKSVEPMEFELGE